MSQFYKIHLAFSRGCFEAIFMKNTLGCLGVNMATFVGVSCVDIGVGTFHCTVHNILEPTRGVTFFNSGFKSDYFLL
jgi:hypothetical protein